MKIKGILETFTDYKKISLIILTVSCDFKCENEGYCKLGTCQNSELINNPTIEISNDKIIENFNNNGLVEGILFAGLEPFLQFEEIYVFIKEFRKTNNEDIVIFTGYYPQEILSQIEKLKEFKNIIIKYGRFIENLSSKYDEVGQVTLASSNQYFEKIS